ILFFARRIFVKRLLGIFVLLFIRQTKLNRAGASEADQITIDKFLLGNDQVVVYCSAVPGSQIAEPILFIPLPDFGVMARNIPVVLQAHGVAMSPADRGSPIRELNP